MSSSWDCTKPAAVATRGPFCCRGGWSLWANHCFRGLHFLPCETGDGEKTAPPAPSISRLCHSTSPFRSSASGLCHAHTREDRQEEDSAQTSSCVSSSEREEFLFDLDSVIFSFISPRELAWLLLSDKVSWLLGNPESCLKLNACTCIDLDLHGCLLLHLDPGFLCHVMVI